MIASIYESLSFDLPLLLVSIGFAISLVGAVAWFFTSKGERKSLFVLIFGLATLGAVAGVAGGTSRVGVVGDIIPAALALTGGVATYLFGVDPSKGLVASLCAAAFALALGLGYATGAGTRGITDNKAANLEFCRALYLNADIWGDDRAFCRVTSIFGEQCNWLIADSISKVPESAAYETSAKKFDAVFAQLQAQMAARRETAPNCE